MITIILGTIAIALVIKAIHNKYIEHKNPPISSKQLLTMIEQARPIVNYDTSPYEVIKLNK